jgi:SAM-dependent methyltransferase
MAVGAGFLLSLARTTFARAGFSRPPSSYPAVAGMVPPAEMDFVGGGDFLAIGEAIVESAINHAGLQSSDDVLDIGCGIGRVAIPLTQHLDEDARYEGFDIVSSGIEWCQAKIRSRYPNFHFEVADIRNSYYNPSGTTRASEFRFPYKDESFGFAFATSVFTHMLPVDVEHYLAEASRVLRPGGRLLATFFLLNEESLAGIAAGRAQLLPGPDLGGYRIASQDSPEAVVFYEEPFLTEAIRRQGFVVDPPLMYGSWPGRDSGGVQDALVLRKNA